MADIQWRDGTVTDENMNEIDPNYRFGTRAREGATEAAGNAWEWLGNQPGTYLPDFDGNPETRGLQIAPSGQQIQQGLQIGGQVIGNVADYIDDEVFYGAGKELTNLKTKGDDALYQALDNRGVKVDRDWLGFTTGAALAGAEEGALGPIAKVPKIFGRGPGTAAWLDNIFNSKRLVPDGPDGINTVRNQPLNAEPMQSTTVGGGSRRVSKVGFDPIELEVFQQAALDHRKRQDDLGKKQLMKDFTFQGKIPIIKNKSGQEFMMVRKKKVVNKNEPWNSSNYTLRSVWEIQNDLVTNANWSKTAKDMEQLKASLNKLRLNHPDQFYHVLMEYGGKAYLEHKVAKKQPWFWNRRETDSNFASWLDPSITRNHEGNIRLLFRDEYKALKDVTESKIRAINKKISDDNFKYIIDLEDPIGGDYAKRSNPGNLLIREANSGDLIGIIPDYLQDLFSDKFKNNFNSSKMRGILSKPDIPEFYRIKSGETLDDYRSRILDERIQLIRNRAGQYSRTGMTGHINKDLVDFYELFDNQLGWLETPTYIIDQGLYNKVPGVATSGAVKTTSKVPHHTDAWSKRLAEEELRRQGK